MIEVGQIAPTFTLPDQDGRDVSLSDLKGSWVVLYFYPKDDTPGCTVQACEFTEEVKAFEQLDARILGCSPDSPESHRKFIAKHDLEIDLLSDADHAVIATHGAWGEKSFMGKKSTGVLRSTVLIDPEGSIAAHWPEVTAKGHAAEVAEKLRQLRAGRR